MWASLTVGAGVLGQKNAEKIMREVESKGKKLGLAQFVGSLGLPSLGVRKVEIVLEKSDLMRTLDSWLNGSLRRVKDEVGLHSACEAIIGAIESRREEIVELASITLSDPSHVVEAPAPLVPGVECFVLTGKFEVPKSVIHGWIESGGHKWADEMRKGETTCLVVADPNTTSNKTKKAVAYGCRIVGYSELKSILNVT
jgi:hypothetical protein